MHNELTLTDFTYDFDDSLIAHKPLIDRGASRLMVREKGGSVVHTQFRNLVEYLPANTLIITNNTRVFASRLIGFLETGGKVELFLLEAPRGKGVGSKCSALGRPMKKLKPGRKLFFEGEISCEIIATQNEGPYSSVEVFFEKSPSELMEWMNAEGYIPLPPYIKREDAKPAKESDDSETYQTVYSENTGSVAAPTAGLHFTDALIEKISAKGIQFDSITLHVGPGTFMPVKSEDVSQHVMHSETYHVPRGVIEKIKNANQNKTPVIVVGTTSLRALESLFREADRQAVDPLELCDRWGSTDLFIRPVTREDKVDIPWLDGIITNFHQPGSTLFMLVSALIGFEPALAHYMEAQKERYRFFSYGDSNLFWL